MSAAETAKSKLVEVGETILAELKTEVSSAEGANLVIKVADVVLAGAKTLVEAASPTFAVPFEEMAYGWLLPHLETVIKNELAKLQPAVEVNEAAVVPTTVTEAGKVIANAVAEAK